MTINMHNYHIARTIVITSLLSTLLACGGSDNSASTTVLPEQSTIISGTISPAFNRNGQDNESTIGRAVLGKSATNATGSFSHPANNEVFAGNILASVDVNEPDGIAAVAISFNQKSEVLYLCNNTSQCSGVNFHKTQTSINPADFNIYTGPLTLGLWVIDLNQNQMQVDAVTVNWQRRRITDLIATRNETGDNITLSWQEQSELLRYNIYLASEENVNQQTYQQLADGQAVLSLEGATHTFSDLIPSKTYYFLIVGVDGSGESAFSSQIRMDPNAGIINQPPTANDENLVGNQGQPINGNLLANDADADGNALSVTVIPIRSPKFGDVTLESNGNFTYVPQNTFSGQDSFDYEIQDGQGGFSQASALIEIIAGNVAPQAVDDNYSVATNQTLTIDAPGLLANDSDLNGDALSVSTTPIVNVAMGSLSLATDGSFVYTPNSDFAGVDNFSYQITDTSGLTDTAQVIITVGGQNTPPDAVNDSYSTMQNVTLIVDGNTYSSVLANDSDPDGDNIQLTNTLINNVDNGTLTISTDGLFTYIPNTNFTGIDSFIYEITDGQGGLAQATVTITVAAENQAPVAIDDTASVDEDQTVTIDVLLNDSDPENDVLSIINWQSNNGSVVLNASKLDYSPNENFNGSDTISYTIDDGSGLTDSATVFITINPINDAPVAADDSATMLVGDTIIITVLSNDNDIDGDSLTVTSASTDVGVATINNDNTITFSGAGAGTALITYMISDGNGGTGSAIITVTVNSVNQAPTAVDDSYAVDQDGFLDVDGIIELSLLSNDSDPENDTLTVNTTPVTDVSDGTLVLANDGTFTYQPNVSFFGNDSFEYEINDGNGNTASAFVDITVNQVNTLPIAKPDYYFALPNSTLNITANSFRPYPIANDSDPDLDSLTYNGTVYSTENGSFTDFSDSAFDYTANVDFTGNDSFFYEIDDGNGGSSQALATILVSRVTWAGTEALPNLPLVDFQGISFDGGLYFLVANNNILVSGDAITWGDHFQSTITPILAVAGGKTNASLAVETNVAVGEINNTYVQQTDGVIGRWAKRSNTSNIAMQNVIFSQGEFIATGMQAVLFSSDGIGWLERTPNTAVVFNSAVHDLGRIIIVGNNGTIEVSTTSGVSWLVQTSNTNNNLMDVVSNNVDSYIAVGTAGTVLSSNDGNTWVTRTSNTSSDLNAVTFGNGLYLAVGNTAIITSNDGINWISRLVPSFPLNDVIFDGTKFILVGDQGSVLTTTDGINFQTVNAGDNVTQMTGVAYNGTDLIRSGNPLQLLKSADGISWSPVTSQNYAVNQVEFFNDSFIAVGDNGLILTSPTGNVWTEQSTPTTKNINDVFWFSGSDVQNAPFSLYVAVGDFGLLMTSTDSINWLVEDTSAGTISGHLYGIDHDNDYFVAVGQNGQILVRNNTATPNGTTWMDFFSNTAFGTLKDIVYDGVTNIIVGANGVIVTGTAQGGNFSAINTTFRDNLNTIAYEDSNYIIGSDGGVIFTSKDGTNWIKDISISSSTLRDITMLNKEIYVVGDGGKFFSGNFK